MRIRNKTICSYKLVVLLLSVLAACQPELAPNELVVTRDTLIISSTTALPTATREILTAAPTTTQMLLVETLVPTPIPPLSRGEKEAAALELYQTNADCKLPCWWGIVPGETEWQTAKLFLSTLAINISTGTQSESDPFFSAEVDIPVPESLSQYGFLRQTYFVRDEIIVKITLEGPWGTSNIGTVSEILNNYGPPTEVLLSTLGYVFHAGDDYPFHIVLFYPEKGMLIRYFDDAELIDDHLTGCIQEDSGTPVLWSPNLKLTFIEALGKQNSAQYYKSLEEATDMDLETFYQTYLDPNTDVCIETPGELWMDK